MTGSLCALMPDYLRLVALFGIVVVNVQYIAFSALHSFADPVGETLLDAIVLWLVNGLALLKTYGLFSFMFGVGLGFLMRSVARRGLPFGRLYKRRLIGLLILGFFHGCLFFVGDILMIYALAGLILYLFRDRSVRWLVRVGTALVILQVFIATPLLLIMPETPPDIIAMERNILSDGNFLEAVMFRSIGFAFVMPSFLVIQGTSSLGWFCIGLAAVKSGIIDDAAHPALAACTALVFGARNWVQLNWGCDLAMGGTFAGRSADHSHRTDRDARLSWSDHRIVSSSRADHGKNACSRRVKLKRLPWPVNHSFDHLFCLWARPMG